MSSVSYQTRLNDIATKIALYSEGVKSWQSEEYNKQLQELSKDLKVIFANLNYKTLDGLSKRKLAELIRSVKHASKKVFGSFAESFAKQIEEFVNASLHVNKLAYASDMYMDFKSKDNIVLSEAGATMLFFGLKDEKENKPIYGWLPLISSYEELMPEINNSPIQANGMLLIPFLTNFANSATQSLENLMRKAWAQNLSIAETLELIFGAENEKQGNSGQLKKLAGAGAGVIHTALAHVAAITAVAVQSTFARKYKWNSVIDSRTSEICFSRNGKVYEYGKGPLPPAHIRCRSSVSPYVGNESEEETFYKWAMRQPESFQSDIFSDTIMSKIRAGRITAKDLQKYEVLNGLTFEQFKSKVRFILQQTR